MSLRDYLFYEEPGITLYCGDCREVVIDGADRVITDPPYGFGAYETDSDDAVVVTLEQYTTVATTAVFGYPEQLVSLLLGIKRVPTEWVVWWPTNKPSARSGNLLPRESEHIAILGDVPGASRIIRQRSLNPFTLNITNTRGNSLDTCRDGDVWRDASPGAGFNRRLRCHPNEKPMPVMKRLVDLCSEPGDAVFDPFAGSGTTLEAAKALGRRAIGIEIEPKYCEITVKRLRQEVLI